MESAKRAQLEAWLRYAEELGLGPCFRHRTPSQSRANSNSLADSAAEPPVAMPPPFVVAAAASAAASRDAAPEAAPRNVATDLPDRGVSAMPKIPPASGVAPAPAGPSLFDASERIEGDTLERIREDIGPNCTRCKLHKARTKIVFGVGNPKAQLVFVGEGPGRDEDVQGEPFVGRAGKLLTQMIEAMGLRRDDVYICNVVKCRPPENRLPEKDEIATCSPYLVRQLGVIQPKVICCLGACAAQSLLQTTQGISRFRGEWFDWRGAKIIATYHPAYLLRNPAAKGEVWKDLQKVMAVLGLEPRRR